MGIAFELFKIEQTKSLENTTNWIFKKNYKGAAPVIL